MRARTKPEPHSFSKNLRAVARSISCSWLNPKSMDYPLLGANVGGKSIQALSASDVRRCSASPLALRQAEHALADDVLLNLRGASFDRVRARAEERVLPAPAVQRPLGALHELGVRPLDLHRELLQLLVRLDPPHLAGGSLGARDLALEQLGDGARPQILQRLGVDPELRQLLAHDGVLRDHAPALLHLAGHLDEPL